MPSDPGDRLTAFGNQLVEVHIWLREQLEDLQDALDAYSADHHGAGPGSLPRDLRAHCLAFCSALTRHHTGEEGEAFPAVVEEFPELRPVIVELRTDHNRIDWILGAVTKLLDGLESGETAVAEVRTELEGLTSIMETHFRYEEKKLLAALNALRDPSWTATRPDFLRTDPNP